MAEDDGLSRTPVLVEYLGTVFGGDRGHREPPSLTEILHRYSIIRVSCALAAIRPLSLRHPADLARCSKRFFCPIGRRDAAQAHFATSVINRTDAVQDTRRLRPQSWRRPLSVDKCMASPGPPL